MVAPVKPYTELALICGDVSIGQVEALYLQRKLSSVQDCTLERVFLNLEVCLSSFTRAEKVLQYMRQQALPPFLCHEEICRQLASH